MLLRYLYAQAGLNHFHSTGLTTCDARFWTGIVTSLTADPPMFPSGRGRNVIQHPRGSPGVGTDPDPQVSLRLMALPSAFSASVRYAHAIFRRPP